jgi:hypothetical protein
MHSRLPRQCLFPVAVLCGWAMQQAALAGGAALVITDKGYQIMTVGADGAAVLQPVSQVVDLRTTPGTDPVPGPTPAPPSSTTAAKVKELASAVDDPGGAAILAAVVKALLEAKLPPTAYETSPNALGMAFSSALVEYEKTSPGARTRWQPFRDGLSSLINEQRSQGKLGTQAQWDRFLSDTQSGLEGAAGGAALLEQILRIITTLLPIILEIVRLFGGGV